MIKGVGKSDFYFTCLLWTQPTNKSEWHFIFFLSRWTYLYPVLPYISGFFFFFMFPVQIIVE